MEKLGTARTLKKIVLLFKVALDFDIQSHPRAGTLRSEVMMWMLTLKVFILIEETGTATVVFSFIPFIA